LPYKTKTSTLENQLEKVDQRVKIFQEQADTSKLSLNLIEKLNVELKENVFNLNKRIQNLEARLSDCKDFIFRFSTDKLDDFNKCYRF